MIFRKKTVENEKTDTREASKRVRKVLGYSFLGIIGCMAYSEFMSKKLEIIYDRDNEVTSQLLYKMDFLNKGYKNCIYLPFRFMQMILAAKIEKPPYIKTSLEQLILDDGDFIDMEWTGINERSAIYSDPEEHRIALVWGNVNGSNNDTYSRHTIEELYRSGFRTAFVHYRNARLASNPNPHNFMTYTA